MLPPPSSTSCANGVNPNPRFSRGSSSRNGMQPVSSRPSARARTPTSPTLPPSKRRRRYQRSTPTTLKCGSSPLREKPPLNLFLWKTLPMMESLLNLSPRKTTFRLRMSRRQTRHLSQREAPPLPLSRQLFPEIPRLPLHRSRFSHLLRYLREFLPSSHHPQTHRRLLLPWALRPRGSMTIRLSYFPNRHFRLLSLLLCRPRLGLLSLPGRRPQDLQRPTTRTSIKHKSMQSGPSRRSISRMCPLLLESCARH